MADTIKTRNEAWGFYGTITNQNVDTDKAWGAAIKALGREGMIPTTARDFLDSRFGRHLADEVGNKIFSGISEIGNAVDAAVEQFAQWGEFSRFLRTYDAAKYEP